MKAPTQALKNFAKQNKYICQLCLCKVENEEEYTVDHIYPKSLGGKNTADNRQWELYRSWADRILLIGLNNFFIFLILS